MAAKKQTYEQAMKRLEEIVSRIDSNELDIASRPTISPSREANCFTKPFMKPMIAPKPKAANMMISIIAIKLMYQCDNMLMWQLAALYSAWHICTLRHIGKL